MFNQSNWTVGMGVNVERLARVLCKLRIDPLSTDTPEVIWDQMRPDNKAVFLAEAHTIIKMMGWSAL